MGEVIAFTSPGGQLGGASAILGRPELATGLGGAGPGVLSGDDGQVQRGLGLAGGAVAEQGGLRLGSATLAAARRWSGGRRSASGWASSLGQDGGASGRGDDSVPEDGRSRLQVHDQPRRPGPCPSADMRLATGGRPRRLRPRIDRQPLSRANRQRHRAAPRPAPIPIRCPDR